jgi:hypothetical protein
MSHTHLFERRGKMPAESLVYRGWKNGLGRTEMAARHGVTEHGVREYLRRQPRPRPPAKATSKLAFAPPLPPPRRRALTVDIRLSLSPREGYPCQSPE